MKNASCVFPFKYKNVIHNECTYEGMKLHEEHPWCSTEVNSKGEHIKGKFGFCEPQCLGKPKVIENPGKLI